MDYNGGLRLGGANVLETRIAELENSLTAERSARAAFVATALAHDLTVAIHDARSLPTISEIKAVLW
ncbi:MAG: hypothetical protein AAFX94_08985 [Myxococcota bacterium]